MDSFIIFIIDKIYSELREEERSRKIGEKKMENVLMADFSSFYVLLIVVPELTECYETMNILKYYDFPINIEEDNLLKQNSKKDMGFKPED